MKLCIDCNERPVFARKRCHPCYDKWNRSASFYRIHQRYGAHCRLCDKPVRALELCNTHYMRLYRHGAPEIVHATNGRLIERG